MKKKPKTKEETELFAARAARRRLESRQPDLHPQGGMDTSRGME